MKVVHIAKYGKFPILQSLPIPELGDSELLIKMKYAPINPSDLFFYQGKYGIIKQGFPIVGFEGSGVIQEAKNEKLIGKKVTVMSNLTNGTHATHIKSSIKQVMIWPDDADLKQISMAFVNPMACIGLCSIVIRQNPQNVLVSAAASQIGRMMISYLRRRFPEMKIYALNRSRNKSQLLSQLGVTETIMIQDPPADKLKQLQGKTVFLDCVGGQFAGKTFNVLGLESQMVCYGKQSGQDLGSINLAELYYKNKTIRGFWLNNWLKQISREERQKAKSEIVQDFNEFYKSTVRKVFKIEDFMEAYSESVKDKSQGKILLDLS